MIGREHHAAARDEAEQIAARARRKREARHRRVNSHLYGISMFGLVGWPVALPIVLGTALGLWIEFSSSESAIPICRRLTAVNAARRPRRDCAS